MRNYLGLTLVIAYFAHAVGSVAFAATVPGLKDQAVWLSAPIALTPEWLLDLLPTVAGPKSYSTWYLQTLINYPAGFAYTSVLFYFAGWVLQRVWFVGLWPAITVGAFIGFCFGGLWFLVTYYSVAHPSSWFCLGIPGALISALIYSKIAAITSSQLSAKK